MSAILQIFLIFSLLIFAPIACENQTSLSVPLPSKPVDPGPLDTPFDPDAPENIAIIPPVDHVPKAPPSFVNSRNTMEPSLMGGHVPDMTKFQAVVWIGNCTATLVGPQALYTAAHCVGRGGIQFTKGSKSYSGSCRIAKEYADGNHTADYALCKINKPVEGVDKWESVNLDSLHIAVGDTVLLSGYGCLRWGGGIDGRYRVGAAEVTRVPSRSDNDYVAKRGATLCSGDSGGPAWSLKPDASRNKLIAINSRSNTTNISFISATGSKAGKRFLGAWQSIEKAQICGSPDEPSDCLNGGPGIIPPQDDYFVVDMKFLKLAAFMKPGFETMLEDAKKAIEDALDAL